MQCMKQELYHEGLCILKTSKTSPAAIDWSHKHVLNALTSRPHDWAEYVVRNTSAPERKVIRTKLLKAERQALVFETVFYVIRVPAALGSALFVASCVVDSFVTTLQYLEGYYCLASTVVFIHAHGAVADWRAEKAACEFVGGYLDAQEESLS